METIRTMPSRITNAVIELWGVLFVGLLVAYLLVSLRLGDLHSDGLPLPKPAPITGPGPNDLYVAVTLVAFLILFIWSKTRRFVKITGLFGFWFGLLVFGWYQTLMAYFSTDLQDYSERLAGASVALLVCVFLIVSVFLLLLVKSRIAKQQQPPII
ncbi:MAG TPA: hypothetical protein VIK53_06705 [Verrucomicrobiae bacterium]